MQFNLEWIQKYKYKIQKQVFGFKKIQKNVLIVLLFIFENIELLKKYRDRFNK